MRVVLDRGRCQGHGRCYALAPDVFVADDDGYGVVNVAAASALTGHVLRQAETAAANCPEDAITVIAPEVVADEATVHDGAER